MQRGDGEYLPHVLVPRGRNKAQLPGNFSVEFVQYVPSLHAHMEAADLIISHAGSGSLFEALSLHKAVIAVPNSSLMANHQVTKQPFGCLPFLPEDCTAPTNLSLFHSAIYRTQSYTACSAPGLGVVLARAQQQRPDLACHGARRSWQCTWSGWGTW